MSSNKLAMFREKLGRSRCSIVGSACASDLKGLFFGRSHWSRPENIKKKNKIESIHLTKDCVSSKEA